jgi:hypothetical protein
MSKLSVLESDYYGKKEKGKTVSATLESKYSQHEGMVCGYEPILPSEKLTVILPIFDEQR